MERSRSTLWAAVLGIAGSLGCGDRGAPTEPRRGMLDIEKVVSPPTGLSGTWSGTIRFFAFNGDYVVLPCDGTAPISVTLNQDAEHLTGQFQSGCAGMLEIRGYIIGDRISGALESSTGQLFGRIFGIVSSSEVRFQTITYIDEHGDGAPDTDGDGSVRSSDVELHRSVRSERDFPVRADASGRFPRVLAARRP
jgi:hypothetical protein